MPAIAPTGRSCRLMRCLPSGTDRYETPALPADRGHGPLLQRNIGEIREFAPPTIFRPSLSEGFQRNIRALRMPRSGGRVEAKFQGLSDRDVARAAMGQGWPFAACP